MEEDLSDVAQRKIMLQLKSSESPSDSGSTVAKVSLEGAVKLLESARLVAWDYTWNLGPKKRHAIRIIMTR